MLHSVIIVDVFFRSPGLMLTVSIAIAVLLQSMLFGLIDAKIVFRPAAWVTIAFVCCGLVTSILGLVLFGFLYAFSRQVVFLELCLVLSIVGVLAIAVPFLPDAWLGGDVAAERRRRTAFRFLLGFAFVGFLAGLVVGIAPPITFQSIRAALFWICPGAIPGTMFGGASFAQVVLTAFINGAFFGALGGVIGTALSVIRTFAVRSQLLLLLCPPH